MIRKNLARAMADTQPGVVTAERSVQIASFTADATVKTAQGQAKAKEANATADAMVLKTVGAAEGEKILAVGTSEAEVIKKKTAAMDPEKYAMVEVARALAGSGFKLVPDIIATGGADGGNSLGQHPARVSDQRHRQEGRLKITVLTHRCDERTKGLSGNKCGILADDASTING